MNGSRKFLFIDFFAMATQAIAVGMTPSSFASGMDVFVSGANFRRLFLWSRLGCSLQEHRMEKKKDTRMTRRVGRDFSGISLRGALKSRDMLTFSEGLDKGGLAFFNTAQN